MKHKHLYLETNLAHSMRLPKNKIASEAQKKKKTKYKDLQSFRHSEEP